MSLDQQDREQNAGENGRQPQPQPPVQPKVRLLSLKSHALASVVLAGFLILTGCSTGNPALALRPAWEGTFGPGC